MIVGINLKLNGGNMDTNAMSKLTPLQHEIIAEISKCFDRLGAERGVFAALHSWGDTLPDAEILKMLKELNV